MKWKLPICKEVTLERGLIAGRQLLSDLKFLSERFVCIAGQPLFNIIFPDLPLNCIPLFKDSDPYLFP